MLKHKQEQEKKQSSAKLICRQILQKTKASEQKAFYIWKHNS